MKQFHAFRLDTVNHCLWRGEERVLLAPKAFDVLRYLVEHADRLVTQEELLNALWPETYVNPEVIKKYILGIRKALGDPRDKPEFIETFPRRGYQFIAPVSEVISGAPTGCGTNATRNMVGREGAMAELDDYLGQALNSQRQVVFITGEAGIGKTTLVDVFHQEVANRPNLRIIRGQCVEGFGGKEAYYPVLEAIGQWVREAGGGEVIATLAKQAPTWLIQFPSLIRPEQREALQKEIHGATRERMVREICEALETLTAQDPLVLVLEDLHWVDPSTLDFLSAVARRRGPAKLLVIGTYRPADLILSKSPLKVLKQDLVLHNQSHEISLERLEEPDVAEYVEVHFANGDFPRGFANLIYRHSGGNALFLANILLDMVKRGLIAQVDGAWKLKVALEDVEPRVPETLDQLIEAQFQQLSCEEQRILRTASVAGERFSVWAISTAAELEPEVIEDVCERLAERLQFIKAAGINALANGEISAHYEFRHSLYREVLYRRLSEVARSKLHLQLAQRLQALCDPCEQEQSTELAMHFEAGRNYEEAIRYLIVAAKNAARRFAYQDSIEILGHALELIAQVTASHRAELKTQVLVQIGDIHYAVGNMDECAQAYEEAAALAKEASLGAAEVTALIRLVHPMGLIDVDRAVEAVEQADQISASLNDPILRARTQILAPCARLYYHTWRSRDAELYTSAKETIDRLTGGLYPEMHYAHLHPLQGRYREALRIAEDGILKISETSNTVAYLLALGAKAMALIHLGRLGEVLQLLRAAIERAEKNGNDPWVLKIREAWLRTVVMDFTGAQELCDAMIRSNSGYPTGQSKAIGWFAAGNAALLERRHAEALQDFQRVIDADVTPKFFLHWYWRMQAQFGVVKVLLALGKIEDARTETGRILDAALSTDEPGLQALAWEVSARLAIAEKDGKAGEKSIRNGAALLEKFELPTAAWRLDGTAYEFYLQAKNENAAEIHRKRAESCILKIANSFAPDEPLRATFLAAAPVRRVLDGQSGGLTARAPKLKRGAVL
ncbi:MAG TPA: AAA family ATPase [Candidatus Baltobacteraceae bacterium]|nr:AAA family ATPase [Candidatus Baltobacteraceae bacterium]